jgi:hypothetical protein
VQVFNDSSIRRDAHHLTYVNITIAISTQCVIHTWREACGLPFFYNADPADIYDLVQEASHSID